MRKRLLSACFLLLCCRCLAQGSLPAADELSFDRLGVREGLSQSTVLAVFQDSYGFIWLGTRDGLNRYDGYQFTVYRHQPADSRSIGGNIINGIAEDAAGNIWAATDQGLSVWYRDSDSFANYALLSASQQPTELRRVFTDHEGRIWALCRHGVFIWEKERKILLPVDQVLPFTKNVAGRSSHCFYKSDSSTVWIGTNRHGLFRLDLRRKHVLQYPRETFDTARIEAISGDNRGTLWVATQGKGLYGLSADGRTRWHLSRTSPEPLRITHDNVRDVLLDADGRVWLGTYEGINIFDPRQGRVQRIHASADNPASLSHNSVRTLFRDRKGSIWIGTYFGGVSIFDADHLRFRHFYHIPGQPRSLTHNVAGAFAEAASGHLLIGTEGGGLAVYSPETGTHSSLTAVQHDARTLSGNTIKALYRDTQNRIWAGIFRGGLNQVDVASGRVRRYPLPGDPADKALAKVLVNCIAEDASGKLWLGTDTHALLKFDPETQRFTTYPHAERLSRLLRNVAVKRVYIDPTGRLWLATHGQGLVVFSEAGGVVAHFRKTAVPGSLPADFINFVGADRQGNVWLATQGSGVARFNQADRTFTTWDTRHGLLNATVYGILPEGSHTLWFVTLSGLSRFDQARRTFRNYSFASGLPLEETNEGAFYQSQEGQLIVGGRNGYVRFSPEKLRDNPSVPIVHLTGLRLSNQEVKPRDASGILEKNIVNTRAITLRHTHAVVTLDFAALSYFRSPHNTYAYRLLGFDEAWTSGQTQRSATYTNLPEGDYVFQVKAANSDGVWNPTPTELRIRVLPPPWRTWWAYVLYAIGIAGGLLMIRQNALRSAQLRHELRMEQFEKEKWKEIHALKLEYFTDISHEIRTPLTLIYNPLREIIHIQEGSPWLKKQLQIMHVNCHRMLRLVDQILEIQKLESGNLHLDYTPARLGEVLEETVLSFRGLAAQKNISLDCRLPPDARLYELDTDKVKKIFYNLLSNAFKFTDNGGRIEVRSRRLVRKATTYQIVKVYDTGKGIAPEQVSRIFERFYKANKHSEGSGIGLAHTQSLVSLLGGRMSVRSQVGVGTCFTVVLPLTAVPTPKVPPETPVGVRITLPAPARPAAPAKPAEPSDRRDVILLVEDNDELREYLRERLESLGRVTAVASAEAALEVAAQVPVQLVISDIRMEGLDGLALCARLKQDIRLSHIPVILLTACTLDTDRISGYRHGADDYLAKPFDTEELLARATSVLQNRRKIHENYKRRIQIAPQEVTPHSPDEKLLHKIVRFLENHIDDSALTVEQLGQEVGLSRVHLYRKLKSLTGLAPTDFIRDFRLKRAAQLLQSGKLKVADVAYQVGFEDVHYFSKCFRKTYGTSPSAFAESQALVGAS
jgi:signal transduction histidine kinase/ligand-binding sensor domain-containing protein/DNA-binding response OmpR family regulator